MLAITCPAADGAANDPHALHMMRGWPLQDAQIIGVEGFGFWRLEMRAGGEKSKRHKTRRMPASPVYRDLRHGAHDEHLPGTAVENMEHGVWSSRGEWLTAAARLGL